ncbi:MAG: hypothetical protein EBR82_50360 [Caulobacteraceae bacterium]|nr:hypothetical protein [Caulobacteraceae bacterium]
MVFRLSLVYLVNRGYLVCLYLVNLVCLHLVYPAILVDLVHLVHLVHLLVLWDLQDLHHQQRLQNLVIL